MSQVLQGKDGHLSFIPIGSSHINEVDFDPATQYLEVTFDDLQRYRYLAVPLAVFYDFAAAGSAGSFFYRHVRSRYAELSV